MIIEENPVEITTNAEFNDSTKFRIAENSFMFSILRDKMYSEPILAVCREIVSNAIDAHIEADIKKPVEVYLNNTHFVVKDFGNGMSPEIVKKVVCVYGESTKRTDNNQIGGFGLGLKSVFSVADQFHIETVHNGIKYIWLAINDGLAGSLNLLLKENTEEVGTTIRIPVSKFYDFKETLEDNLGYLVDKNLVNVYGFYASKLIAANTVYATSKHPYTNVIIYNNFPYYVERLNNSIVYVCLEVERHELNPLPNREDFTKDEKWDKIKEKSTKLIEEYTKKQIDEIFNMTSCDGIFNRLQGIIEYDYVFDTKHFGKISMENLQNIKRWNQKHFTSVDKIVCLSEIDKKPSYVKGIISKINFANKDFKVFVWKEDARPKECLSNYFIGWDELKKLVPKSTSSTKTKVIGDKNKFTGYSTINNKSIELDFDNSGKELIVYGKKTTKFVYCDTKVLSALSEHNPYDYITVDLRTYKKIEKLGKNFMSYDDLVKAVDVKHLANAIVSVDSIEDATGNNYLSNCVNDKDFKYDKTTKGFRLALTFYLFKDTSLYYEIISLAKKEIKEIAVKIKERKVKRIKTDSKKNIYNYLMGQYNLPESLIPDIEKVLLS